MDPGGDLLGAAEEWHYSDGHRVQGPVARETLSSLIRVGQLGPGSLVWHPPWEEWRPLGQVEDFAGLFPDNLHPTPPPLPGNPSGSIGNHCGTQGCVLGGIDWVWCPSGTFRMGSPSNEPGRSNGETNREVTLERGFWIGKFPVTRAQWMKWMADDPGKIRGRDLAMPVENVSWHDARRFCERMSRKEGAEIRLPTEAEWEYACRAGSPGPWCFDSNRASDLPDYAWFSENSDGRSHRVGQKKPNAWGIHDAHGNVWEWCEDRYTRNPALDPVDPRGPQVATGGDFRRVCRGGSCRSPAERCRSAFRHRVGAEHRTLRLGFRAAMNAIP